MNDIITDEAIADAKAGLMSNNPNKQLQCVEWILSLMEYASGDELDQFSKRIIDADVALLMCRIMGDHYGNIFTTMLKIVEKLALNDLFYKYKLAYRAVESIVRVANCTMPVADALEETLDSAVETIFRVLDRASTTEFSLRDVCDPKQMVLFVKRVFPSVSKNFRGRISAARTLILLMKDVQPGNDEEIKSSLIAALEFSLAAIYEMAFEHRASLPSALEITISSCAIATRFCGDTEDGARYTSKIAEILIIFVIPNFRTRFYIAKYEENEKNLIECLAKIHRFKCCDKNLAFALANNGFIEGFIQSSSSSSENSSLRVSMQSIVLYTIETLRGEDIICNLANDEDAIESLCGWYTMLHLVLAKTEIMSGWSVIFRCLRDVLIFCGENKFALTLRRLIYFPATKEIVLRAIDHKYTDPTFFEFTDILLSLRRRTISETQSRLEFSETEEILVWYREKV